MSANKFKVGDKVKVRKNLIEGRQYGCIYCNTDMAALGLSGKTFTISVVDINAYQLEGYNFWWTNEMLEPVSIKKTLKNMEKGDVVVNKPDYDYPRTVLLAIDGCYLLSAVARPTVALCWRTAEELRVSGCTVQQPTPTKIETIEINGKKYNKADVEEAIKDLEVVD